MLGPMVNRLVPAEDTPVIVRSGPAKGLSVVIRPREEKFYWAGTVEPGVQDALVEELGPGMVFWDVGAHCGFFTCLGSRLVGPGGEVVSFEPCEENRTRLDESVRLNAADNVEVRPWALGARSGRAKMQALSTSTTWSTVPDADREGREVDVRVRSLDDCMAELRAPDLVKVDVEGAELEVLKGARGMLAEAEPTLVIEFHSEGAVGAARELLPDHSFEQVDADQWVVRPARRTAPQADGPRDFGRPTGLVRAIDSVPGPVVRGLARVGPVKRGLSNLVGRLMPERETPVVVRSGAAHGLTVVIRPREEKFYWAGTHEPGVQDALVSELDPGASFWDVGAHTGFFSCLAGRIVGSAGQVISFEPCGENRRRLSETIRLNAAGNIRVLPCAVGSRRGEALLRTLEEDQTSMKWGKVEADEEGTIRVPQRTLEDLAAELGAPDLIKVDVEGAEVDVLMGGRELLATARPKLIIEFHDEDALRAGEALLEDYAKARLGRTQWLLTPR
jgi:FkbM family methyltransferase